MSSYSNSFWEFGGALLRQSHAKVRRPISTKTKMLIVLSSPQAKGRYSFHFFQKTLKQLLARTSRIHEIKIYDIYNGGHHLQLVVQTRSRNKLQDFIRSVTGQMARLILKAEKGRPHSQSLWTHRPYTRWLRHTRFSILQKDWVLQDRLAELGLSVRGGLSANFFSSS